MNRNENIAPKTDPIKVGPSRMLFYMARPKNDPTNILTTTTVVKIIPFKIDDS